MMGSRNSLKDICGAYDEAGPQLCLMTRADSTAEMLQAKPPQWLVTTLEATLL